MHWVPATCQSSLRWWLRHATWGCLRSPWDQSLLFLMALPLGTPQEMEKNSETPLSLLTLLNGVVCYWWFSCSRSHGVFSLSMKKGQQMRYHSEKTAAPVLCWPLHEGGGAPHWSYIFLKLASPDGAWGLGAGQDEALAWTDQAGGSLSGATPSVKHAPAASQGIAGCQRTTASAHPTSFRGASSRLQRSQSCSSSVFSDLLHLLSKQNSCPVGWQGKRSDHRKQEPFGLVHVIPGRKPKGSDVAEHALLGVPWAQTPRRPRLPSPALPASQPPVPSSGLGLMEATPLQGHLCLPPFYPQPLPPAHHHLWPPK